MKLNRFIMAFFLLGISVWFLSGPRREYPFLPHPSSGEADYFLLSNGIPKPEMQGREEWSELLPDRVDLDSLRRYEGSYASEDWFSDGNQEYRFGINTAWFYGNMNWPALRLNFRYDPQTETYKITGGRVTFGESGFGMRHETDSDTEETRSMLEFRRRF